MQNILHILFYSSLLHCIVIPSVKSQNQCSKDALAAKYRQYRDRFNSHFIATDRTPGGCINDEAVLLTG